MTKFNVYIGYDEREHIAAEVCRYSIWQRTNDFIPITFLKSTNIPQYIRPREPNQSTDFTYTRFMVPFLEKYQGVSVFCDCDFLFQADIEELISAVDLSYPVSVVKHPEYVPHSGVKMDGIPQHKMYRKNWASLMVFNNAHPSNRLLSPEFINTIKPGHLLHTFDWLNDNEIGSLPPDWNALAGYQYFDNPKAIHYTDGGPWFIDYNHTMYAERWEEEHDYFANSCGAP